MKKSISIIPLALIILIATFLAFLPGKYACTIRTGKIVTYLGSQDHNLFLVNWFPSAESKFSFSSLTRVGDNSERPSVPFLGTLGPSFHTSSNPKLIEVTIPLWIFHLVALLVLVRVCPIWNRTSRSQTDTLQSRESDS